MLIVLDNQHLQSFEACPRHVRPCDRRHAPTCLCRTRGRDSRNCYPQVTEVRLAIRYKYEAGNQALRTCLSSACFCMRAVPASAGRVRCGGRDLRCGGPGAPGAPELYAGLAAARRRRSGVAKRRKRPCGANCMRKWASAAARAHCSGSTAASSGGSPMWWRFIVIEGGEIDFHPNLEVRAIRWAAPDAPPPGTAPATAAPPGRACAGAPAR